MTGLRLGGGTTSAETLAGFSDPQPLDPDAWRTRWASDERQMGTGGASGVRTLTFRGTHIDRQGGRQYGHAEGCTLAVRRGEVWDK